MSDNPFEQIAKKVAEENPEEALQLNDFDDDLEPVASQSAEPAFDLDAILSRPTIAGEHAQLVAHNADLGTFQFVSEEAAQQAAELGESFDVTIAVPGEGTFQVVCMDGELSLRDAAQTRIKDDQEKAAETAKNPEEEQSDEKDELKGDNTPFSAEELPDSEEGDDVKIDKSMLQPLSEPAPESDPYNQKRRTSTGSMAGDAVIGLTDALYSLVDKAVLAPTSTILDAAAQGVGKGVKLTGESLYELAKDLGKTTTHLLTELSKDVMVGAQLTRDNFKLMLEDRAALDGENTKDSTRQAEPKNADFVNNEQEVVAAANIAPQDFGSRMNAYNDKADDVANQIGNSLTTLRMTLNEQMDSLAALTGLENARTYTTDQIQKAISGADKATVETILDTCKRSIKKNHDDMMTYQGKVDELGYEAKEQLQDTLNSIKGDIRSLVDDEDKKKLLAALEDNQLKDLFKGLSSLLSDISTRLFSLFRAQPSQTEVATENTGPRG